MSNDDEGNIYISLILDISASREARNFFQKSKYNYIEKSTLWAQSGFCSSNRLEMASKRVNLVQDWWACKNYEQMMW